MEIEKPLVKEPIAHGAAQNGAAPIWDAWFGEMDQSEFEIDFFERILYRQPNHVPALRALSEQLAKKRLYHRSLAVDARLVELRPDDWIVRYNLACALALHGHLERSLDQLTQAIQHGYRDFAHMEVDPDLEGVRQTAAYRALVEKLQIGLG